MAVNVEVQNFTALEKFEQWAVEIGIDLLKDTINMPDYTTHDRFFDLELEKQVLNAVYAKGVSFTSCNIISIPLLIDNPIKGKVHETWMVESPYVEDYKIRQYQCLGFPNGVEEFVFTTLKGCISKDGLHAIFYYENSGLEKAALYYSYKFDMPYIYIENLKQSPQRVISSLVFNKGEFVSLGNLLANGSNIGGRSGLLLNVDGLFWGRGVQEVVTRKKLNKPPIEYGVVPKEIFFKLGLIYQTNVYGNPNRGGAQNPDLKSNNLLDVSRWGAQGITFKNPKELPLIELDKFTLAGDKVGFMTGTVKINGSPTRSVVILLTRYTFQEVGRVMSNADGTFRFDNLAADREYFAISHHRGLIYNMVAQDSLMPEVYKVEEEVPTVPPTIGDKDRTFKAFKAWKEGLETEKGLYTHGGVPIEKQGSCHSSAYACTKWSYEQTKKSIKGSANGYNTGVGGDYYNTRINPIEIKEFALAANFILIDFMKEFEEWDS